MGGGGSFFVLFFFFLLETIGSQKNETRRYQLHVGITVWEDGAATRYCGRLYRTLRIITPLIKGQSCYLVRQSNGNIS